MKKNSHSLRPKKIKKKEIISLIFNFIRILFKGDRLARISSEINEIIKEIGPKNKKIIILDYGCGNMQISKYLLKKKTINKSICVDTYKYVYKKKNIKYINQSIFNNKKLKKKYFDATIIVDTLHHIGTNNSVSLLKKISKISKYIIVKEHFEYGYFSRQLLRFIDFFGNYAYDVNIPEVYFNDKTWRKTYKLAKLKQLNIIKKFQQHDGLFNLILNKKYHFISILKS